MLLLLPLLPPLLLLLLLSVLPPPVFPAGGCPGIRACQDLCHRSAAAKHYGGILSLDLGSAPCWGGSRVGHTEPGWGCIVGGCPLTLEDLDHDGRSLSKWVEVEASTCDLLRYRDGNEVRAAGCSLDGTVRAKYMASPPRGESRRVAVNFGERAVPGEDDTTVSDAPVGGLKSATKASIEVLGYRETDSAKGVFRSALRTMLSHALPDAAGKPYPRALVALQDMKDVGSGAGDAGVEVQVVVFAASELLAKGTAARFDALRAAGGAGLAEDLQKHLAAAGGAGGAAGKALKAQGAVSVAIVGKATVSTQRAELDEDKAYRTNTTLLKCPGCVGGDNGNLTVSLDTFMDAPVEVELADPPVKRYKAGAKKEKSKVERRKAVGGEDGERVAEGKLLLR